MEGLNDFKYFVFTIELVFIQGGILNLKAFLFAYSMMSKGTYLGVLSFFSTPHNFSYRAKTTPYLQHETYDLLCVNHFWLNIVVIFSQVTFVPSKVFS